MCIKVWNLHEEELTSLVDRTTAGDIKLSVASGISIIVNESDHGRESSKHNPGTVHPLLDAAVLRC